MKRTTPWKKIEDFTGGNLLDMEMNFMEEKHIKEDHLENDKQRLRELFRLGERQMHVLAPFMGEKTKRKNFKKMDREEKAKAMRKSKTDTGALSAWILKTKKEDLGKIKDATRRIEGCIKNLGNSHRTILGSCENLHTIMYDGDAEKKREEAEAM